MAKTPEQKAANRACMRKKRLSDPQAARDYAKRYHRANRETQIAKMRAYYARRFFWGRAMKLRGEGRATAKELAALWRRQRGICALTGRKLNRTAQLDHISARARGGDDQVGNLQWTCKEVNLAKRELTHREFFQLCGDVYNFAAHKILTAQA